jgi:hypothetical protein
MGGISAPQIIAIARVYDWWNGHTCPVSDKRTGSVMIGALL